MIDGRQPAGGHGRWCAISLALFVAALLSKTVVASLPAVILVILWWKRGRLSFRDIVPLVPFFAVGIGLGLFTVWMEKNHVGARGHEFDFSFAERLLIAGRAVWFYAEKLAWPSPLVFFYPRFQIDDHALWQYLFPIAALALIAAARWWVARKNWPRAAGGSAGFLPVYWCQLWLGFFKTSTLSAIRSWPIYFQYHASLALIRDCAPRVPRGFGHNCPNSCTRPR